MFRWHLQIHMRDGKHLQWLAQKEFLRAIRTGRLIAFVGSYATEDLGYKKWGEFMAAEAARHGGSNPLPWIEKAIEEMKDETSSSPVFFDLVEEYKNAHRRGASTPRDAWTFNQRKSLADKEFGLPEVRGRSLNRSTPQHVVESLGINRVITTNYDLEFEWLWLTTAAERRDSSPYGGTRSRKKLLLKSAPIERDPDTPLSMVRKLPDGRSAISDIFQRDRSDRLIEFAVGSPDYEAHIMHLHGRSNDPQTMVVSLGDYQDQYWRSGITKLPFEHAQRMLFAGNPVLFVGLGMSEDLITATLEQFVSDHPARHLAPAFVIWSPTLDVAGSPSREDQIKRLSWYRRFGVLTLFDNELAPTKQKTRHRVSRSIRLLGAFAKDGIKPFEWKREQFRTMQSKFNRSPCYHIWKRRDVGRNLKLDFFDGTKAHTAPSAAKLSGIDRLQDREIFKALFQGPPIKAFIDQPGSGHGYLSKVLAEAFSEVAIDGVCAVVNANFVCEVDATFSLLSGLYDEETAFTQRLSRMSAIRKYEADLEQDIKSGGRVKSILVVISGMDRFFDTSGYPLSNELDIALRRASRAYKGTIQAGGKALTLHDWVREQGTVNPYSIILLGTPRVQRYLEELDLERRPADDQEALRTPGDFDIMNGRIIANSRNFVKEVIHRYRATPGAKRSTARPRLPIESFDESSEWAYLLSVREAFAAKKCRRNQLSISRRALIEQSDRRRRGDQRHSFMGAYLQSDTLGTALQSEKELADLCLDILSTMAFVGQPVETVALAKVPRVFRRLKVLRAHPAPLETAIQFLLDVNLIIEFEAFPDNPAGCQRFGLHRSVMAELRDRYGVPISDAKLFGGFNVSLFASQPIDDYTPEKDIHQELGDLVQAMLEAVENGKKGKLDPNVGPWLRVALSVMRSYFTTSALLMHEPPGGAQEESSAPLTDHGQRLEQLLRLAEEAAVERALAKAANPKRDLGPEPFFPDDVVWLHNELGVLKLAQGDLYEARHAFDQAIRINTDHVEFGDKLQNWRRIQLNQLHLDIERAKIGRAESRILEIEQAINDQAAPFKNSSGLNPGGAPQGGTAIETIILRYGAGPRPRVRVVDPHFPADLILSTGLVTGYRGLCSFLRGQMKTGRRHFEHALEILRNIGEHRAYALFLRLYASLLSAMGEQKKAQEAIRLCIAAANSSRQMDISHLAFITDTDQHLAAGTVSERPTILPQMMDSLQYAATTDMYRIRMEVRKTLARIRLAAGDYDGALEHAAEAMAVATRYGFSLRKISLRILIGQLLIRRGDPKSGNALLEKATMNADRVGYQRAVELARHVKMNDNPLTS